MGTKVTLWMIAASLTISAAMIGVTATPSAATSVRLASNQPDAESRTALGVTNAIAPANTLSMRVVMALRDQRELTQLLADLQDPSSPDYHHWLTPDEFTTRFGPTAEDLAKVSAWLTAQGFTVTSASASDRLVRFSGSAAHVAAAFQVRMGASADGRYFANLDSPSVPANLAGVIQSVQGLDNLYRAHVTPLPESKVAPTKKLAFGPPDMYVFYDETPLLTGNINGAGADCIALPEFSDFDDASVAAFDNTFHLPALINGTNLVRVNVDGPPGFISEPPVRPTDNQFEALLDVEYSHAAAPQAPIRVYIAGNADANLPVAGFLDTVQQAVTDNVCGSISLSIGVCPSDAATANNADTIYQQAAVQGQTIFAASDDDGAAALTVNGKGCVPSKKRGVFETAASPNVTAVGGTQSKPKYDKATDIVTAAAAETVWHEAIGAGGGGASAVFAKPAYQNGITPDDNARDIPDIALLAAVQTPGYFVGLEGAVLCCGGGTSFGSPYWAGIGALMEQLNGGRLGPLNTLLYSLASANAADNGIRDVTKGNNGFNGVKGYTAKPGYDQASGWGTPDISVFAHAFTGK